MFLGVFNGKLISFYIININFFFIKKIKRNFFSVHTVYKIKKDEFYKIQICRTFIFFWGKRFCLVHRLLRTFCPVPPTGVKSYCRVASCAFRAVTFALLLLPLRSLTLYASLRVLLFELCSNESERSS